MEREIHILVHPPRLFRSEAVCRTFLAFLFALNILTFPASSQQVSAIKGLQLFDAENYTEAEGIFRILLDEDPGNPMLNYYYGATRTENGHFGQDELDRLLKAGTNIIPDRLHYYLGMQYHARNEWDQALKYYNQFRLSMPENEQHKLEIAKKIQQCFDRHNPYTPNSYEEHTPVVLAEATRSDAITPDPAETAEGNSSPEVDTPAVAESTTAGHAGVEPVNISSDHLMRRENEKDDQEKESEIPAVVREEKFVFERELLPDLPGVQPTYPIPSGDPVEFQVNHQITYLFSSQFQTSEGKEFFEKGNKLQTELNQLLDESDALRKQYTQINDPAEKQKIGEKILTYESDAYLLQEEIKKMFMASRENENRYWNQATPTEKHNFLVELEKIKAGLEQETEDQTQPEEASLPLLISDQLTEPFGAAPEFHGSGKADQLVYKIQLGAYSRGIPAYRKRLFNKLGLIRKIDQYTDENGVVIYTTGILSSEQDAQKMLAQIKQEGAEDAIIVPYFNGKRITLEQAKKIESGDDIKTN
ncbi:MAG: hypothetical protein WCY58_06390 [Mariniphaga sp.]